MWLMKDELSGNTITEFATLAPKRHNYLTNDNNKNDQDRGTKKLKPKVYWHLKIVNLV